MPKKNDLSSLTTFQNFFIPLNSPLPSIYNFFQPWKDGGMRTSFTHPVLPECLNVYVCVYTHTQCLNVYTFPIYNFSFTSYTIKKLKNKNKKLFSLSLNTLTMSLTFSITSTSLNSKPRKEGKIPPMGPTIIVTRGRNRHPQSNLNP